MKTISRILVVVALLCSSAAVQANNREQRALNAATEAMKLGNYAEAFCLLKPLAERGNTDAQYNIGWMYHNGYGLAINDETAIQWWDKAARQNHTGANLSLGLLYQHGGLGVKKDLDKAIGYLVKAAEAGEEEAQFVLRGVLVREPDKISAAAPDLLTRRWEILGTPMIVKVELANVRSGPGKDHPIVIGLKQNDLVVELLSKGNWVQAFVPSKQRAAWMHNSLLRRASESEIARAKGH